jgi:hypothetical protein
MWRFGPRMEEFGAEPSRAEPSRAEPSRAEPSRAEPSRAEPSRAEPSRAEPSRARRGRAVCEVVRSSKKITASRSAPVSVRLGGPEGIR